MATPEQSGLIPSPRQSEGITAITALMESLISPKRGISLVLEQALGNGSLKPAQASGALASDQELVAIIKCVAPYRDDPTQLVERDFSSVNSGDSQQQLAALGRLTAGFWAARDVLSSALEAGGGVVDPGLQRTATHFNAGYVLLIATVHSIIDTAQDTVKPQLFRIFTELLEADSFLEQLVTYFKDVRNSVSVTSKIVAVRTLFNKFCSEAAHPTIYGEKVSAVVQSMLIRELRQVMEQEARQSTRHLAPHLAELFEEKMRREVNTALQRDGKPQPVLQALRRCPSEARCLMEAVVAFLLESDSNTETDTGNSATACEVMLSVGCLLPGTRLANRLVELLQAEIPANLALLFLSALKFSCLNEDSDQRADPGWIVEYGMWLLPQLADEQKTRLVGEVFAPLDDNFVEYLASSPDTWVAMGPNLRAQCIQEVLAARLEREARTGAMGINRVADRSVVAALLAHLAPPMSIALDRSVNATSASGVDEGCNRDVYQTPSVPILPDVCLRWLVQNIEGCGVSPELCTELVRYILEQAGGFDSLGLDAGVTDALLRQGGFPTLRLLAERQSEKGQLAKLLGEYETGSDVESAFVQGVFEDQFIGGLRRLINIRAATINSRAKLEQVKIGLQEKSDATVNERRRTDILSRQVGVLTSFLNEHTPYIKAERELREAEQKLTIAESEYEDLQKLTRREIIAQNKAGTRERLPDEIETHEATIQEIKDRKFKLPPEAASELPDWKSTEIMFGQYHAMQDTLGTLQSKLARADSAFEEIQAEIDGLDREVASSTQEILSLYPLVRYACQSSALGDLDPSQLCLQDKDTGTTDLVGVMCKINLVLARQNTQAMDAASKESHSARLIGVGKDISLALQSAFRDKAQKAQSLAVLADLADLAGASCPLFSAWVECEASKDAAKYSLQSLQDEVSLPELLYRNMRYELSDDTMSWCVAGRAGWDESFHGPVTRLFASLARDAEAARSVRKRSLAVAMDGIIAEVKRHEHAARVSAEDASQPVDERRAVPSNLVPIPDLLRAWTDVLRATGGNPGGSNVGREQGIQQVRNITEQLAVRASELVAAASEAEMDCCFIPAGKVFVKLSKGTESALYSLPERCKPFLSNLKIAIEARQKAREQAATQPPNEGNSPRASGLDFPVNVFSSLIFPTSRKIQPALGAGNTQNNSG